jgi:ubiquinone/menaquinone biosynthesis C-methylase UbiE
MGKNVLRVANRGENQRQGFDIRIVSYEEIHAISQMDFDCLVEVLDVRDGQRILDAGAGYGAVTREILRKHREENLLIYAVDISSVQLQRAMEHLRFELGDDIVSRKVAFQQDSVVHLMCADCFFDRVAAKMVLHEIRKEMQQTAVDELFRVLKPQGKLCVWDLMLDDETQQFFQRVIRKKDELAGFRYLEKYRYFLKETEFLDLIRRSGFENVQKCSEVRYELHTQTRLQQ